MIKDDVFARVKRADLVKVSSGRAGGYLYWFTSFFLLSRDCCLITKGCNTFPAT